MSSFEEKISSLLNDPEQMGTLTRVAKSLMDSGALGAESGEEKKEDSGGDMFSSIPDFDPKMISLFGKVMSSQNAESDKTAMLKAMAPYLSDKRKTKLEKAIRIAKMAKIAGSVMEEFGGNSDGI